jgi:LruC domain-containing protein
MKKSKNIILILFVLTNIFSSCFEIEPLVEPESATVIESVRDLTVPLDFDWKTSQTLDISVVLPNNGAVQPLIITNNSGSKTYFRGYPDNGSRTLNTIITIPAHISQLRLIYNGTNGPNVVSINGSSLTYDYSTRAQSESNRSVSPIDLGTIANFTCYTNVGAISNVGTSDITGDVGSGTGAISGFGPPSTLNGTIHSGNLVTAQAELDLAAVLIQLNNTVTTNSTHAPVFGSETLVPGVYAIGAAASIAGTLTLDGEGDPEALFVFKVGGAFSTGANSQVVLINGASAENTYWVCTGAASMAAGTSISGNIFGSPGAVSMGLGCELNGRLIATSGAVSMLSCTFIIPDQSQSIIEVSSICTVPDVVFTISNTGEDMGQSKIYTLLKNDIVIQTDYYQLILNESIEITSEATIDDVFRLEVATSAQGILEETIEGCGEIPSEQFSGTLIFEDLWPSTGDFDLNDHVVDYDFITIKNNQEVVQSMTATFTLKAFGASFRNGFGFTLATVKPNDIVSVTGYDVINHTVFDIGGNGLENGQSKATIIVYDDTYRIMPTATGGTGANTNLSVGYTEPVSVVVNIVFANDAITYSELNIGASFNPFVIVKTSVNGAPGLRGKEIHLPGNEPTDLFDETLFGQSTDNSSPGDGTFFVTSDNLPSAMNIIGEPYTWLIEAEDITQAYLKFAEWAESGGLNYPDWFEDKPGYRNNSLLYN